MVPETVQKYVFWIFGVLVLGLIFIKILCWFKILLAELFPKLFPAKKPTLSNSPHLAPVEKSTLEYFEKLQRFAEIQIDRAWKAYALLGTLVAIVIAAGGYMMWKDSREFQRQMRDDIKEEKDGLTKRLKIEVEQQLALTNVQQLIQNKLSEVVNEDWTNEIHHQVISQIQQTVDNRPDVQRLQQELKDLKSKRDSGSIIPKAIELANIYEGANRFDSARGYYSEALDAYIEMASVNAGYQEGVGSMYCKLGEIESQLGNTSNAEKYFKQGLVIFREKVTGENPKKIGIALIQANLGHLYFDLQKTNEARASLQEAINTFGELKTDGARNVRLEGAISRARIELKRIEEK